MTMKKYFQLVKNGDVADIDIYGDIAKKWWSGDDSIDARSLSDQLDELGDVSQINVHINSYGGEVAEGLAIYTALRRHSAKSRTTCDGFACSIASVIFMAGDERVMSDASLLMIHNAWTSAYGANAADLRKLADDMDTITQASKNAYLSRVDIDEEALSDLMDAETWILPEDAVEMGFATAVEEFESTANPSQNALATLIGIVSDRVRASGGDVEPGESEDDDADDPNPDDDGADDADDDSEDGDDQGSEANARAAALGAFIAAVSRR